MKKLIKSIVEIFPHRNFSIRLWDGTVIPPEAGLPSKLCLVINDPSSLTKLIWRPNSLVLGEAFVNGEIYIEGDIESAISIKEQILENKINFAKKFKLAFLVIKKAKVWPRFFANSQNPVGYIKNVKERTRKAIGFHYDHPIEFWKHMLDPALQYSCAYFSNCSESLSESQKSKMDYICRKLNLKPGETLLDIGCGWGGLVMHAARKFGVNATGITLSREQGKYANHAIKNRGLESKCKVFYHDLLELDSSNKFDKIVSVGVIEHFNEEKQCAYFKKAWNLLKQKGVFLNHGMSSNLTKPVETSPSFLDSYVFPDADLTPLHKTLKIAEETGFEIRDVENLREHYVQTLRLWIKNLKKNNDEVLKIIDLHTLRVFQLYMSGFAYYLNAGRIFLFQTLLVKSDNGKVDLPATRAGWYKNLEPMPAGYKGVPT